LIPPFSRRPTSRGSARLRLLGQRVARTASIGELMLVKIVMAVIKPFKLDAAL
jgi:hypothetical protein